MTATLISASVGPSPTVVTTPETSGAGVVDLPDDFDASRVYLSAPSTYVDAAPYEPMYGPLTPTPNRTLIDFVLVDADLLVRGAE